MMVTISLAVADRWLGRASTRTALPRRSTVQFLHIGGLMAAGGMALASDRADAPDTVRRPLGPHSGPWRRSERIHAWVLTALAVVAVSGVAFFLADRKTYWGSVPFWLKMGRCGRCSSPTAPGCSGWSAPASRNRTMTRLAPPARISARASVALWFLTTLLGTVLSNAA